LGIYAEWSEGIVRSVVPGGQGEAAGVKPGMRITSVNGKPYSESLLNSVMEGNVAFTASFALDEE